MKGILKRLLIGFLSTLAVLFTLGVFSEISKEGGVSLGSVITTHVFESFMGMLALIKYSSGLVVLIPAVLIALIDYGVNRYFRDRE